LQVPPETTRADYAMRWQRRIFTARCCAKRGYATLCRLCLRLSVRLSVRDVQVPWSHRLEYFENDFTAK